MTRKIKALLDPHEGAIPRVTAGRRARQQLASKDREISALKQELVRTRGATRQQVHVSGSTPIFFVVGHQKSGTTWLMKMLDAHPEILCWGEGRPFGRKFKQRQQRDNQRGYPPFSLSAAIGSSQGLRSWIKRSVWTRNDNMREHLDNLTRLTIEYFLTQRLLETNKRMVGDKTVLLNPDIVEEIGAIFPDAKVIHITRDGRDVAVSTMHHIWNQAEDRGGNTKITPAQQAKREAYDEDPQKLLDSGEGIFPNGWLKDYAAKWSANIGKSAKDGPVLLGDNYAEVRYEDLLERPEEEIGQLLRFLGADTGEQTVKRCVNAATFEKLSEGRKRGQEAASFYRKGIAGDWKNVFTERNKREFKATAGEVLVSIGYEKNNGW